MSEQMTMTQQHIATKSSDNLHKGILAGFYLIAFFSSISISITQIGIGVMVLSWILLMVREKRFIFSSGSLGRPILFFIGAQVVSALFGINTLHSILAVRRIWITLIFFGMITLITDQKTLKRLLYTMFAGVSIAATYGIAQRLMWGLDLIRPEGQKVIQYAYLQYPNEVLAIGFFKHHLTYAEVILFNICMALSLLIWKWLSLEREKSKNSYMEMGGYFFIFLLTALALFYSFGRGSWVGFIGGLFFMLLFIRGRTGLFIGLAFIISTTVITLSYEPIRNRITSTLDQTDRLYIWKTALDIFADHPLTGIGVDNWEEAAPPYFNYYIDNNIYTFSDMAVTQHAHNNFLHQAAVGGLVGLAAFLYIWFVIFKEGIGLYLRLPEERGLTKGIVLGGLSGIVGFHVAGLFEATYLDSEVAMLHWFIAGLVFTAGRLSGER